MKSAGMANLGGYDVCGWLEVERGLSWGGNACNRLLEWWVDGFKLWRYESSV